MTLWNLWSVSKRVRGMTALGAAAMPRVAGSREEPADAERADVHLVPPVSRDAEFASFMAESMAPLGRLAFLVTGDQHRASELVQETMVRVYFAWSRARTGDPLTYARRVLLNQKLDTWRRRRREVLVDPTRLAELERVRPEPPAPRHEDLVTALRGLNEKSRRIVVLRYVEGLSEAEVAETLGVPLGTVKSSGSRGLTQLRRYLSTADTDAYPHPRD